jgi:hypothetical protein
VLAGTVLVLLAGCAQGGKDPNMTPDESKKQMFDLIDDTISVLGSTAWSDPGDPAPRDCTLPGGATGVNYAATTVGPLSADPEAAINTVEAFWKKKGFTTQVVHSTNPKETQIRLYGTNGPMKDAEFAAGRVGMGIIGDSVCVPGDAGRMIDQEQGDD